MMRIGVLAFLGTAQEHVQILKSLQVDVVKVKRVEHLHELDGLVLPGGEYSAIARLIERFGFIEPLKRIAEEIPIWATGAATALLAEHSILDLTVLATAQESFETSLIVTDVGEDVRAIFIRPPRIVEVGEQVEILSKYEDEIVAIRQGWHIACTFLPELTDDRRFHQLFLSIVKRVKS